jgi:phage baseplate assembly protein W
MSSSSSSNNGGDFLVRPASLTPSPSFLGTGWRFPPSFNPHNHSVVMASGATDIYESLWILISTSLGERIMLATYGCQIWSKVFAALTTTLAYEIASMIRNAILDWEPRVDVENVEVMETAPLRGQLSINITYRIRQTNVRSNLVYPFYRQEATLPPPIP